MEDLQNLSYATLKSLIFEKIGKKKTILIERKKVIMSICILHLVQKLCLEKRISHPEEIPFCHIDLFSCLSEMTSDYWRRLCWGIWRMTRLRNTDWVFDLVTVQKKRQNSSSRKYFLFLKNFYKYLIILKNYLCFVMESGYIIKI